MADEEEIVVEIENDAAPSTVTTAVPDEAPAAKRDPIEDITAQHEEQLAAVRRRAEDAERRATVERQEAERARQEAERARSESVENQLDSVSTGLAAAQGAADAAEAEFIRAQEAGDWRAAAKAQRAIAEAVSRAERLKEAKADMEARKAAPPEERGRAQADDPVEQFLSTRTPQTAEWLRNHREWLTDGRKNAKLNAAHHDAVSEGYALDSPEYFKHVEMFIGLHQATPDKSNGQAQPKRRSTVPVAPVSNGGGGVNGGTNTVTLSSREASAATDGTHVWAYDDPSPQKRFRKGEPIGVQEFARRKQAMTKQGLYDKSFTEV